MENVQEIKQQDQLNEIDERLVELASLFDISKTLSSSLNLQSVLNNILLTPMGRMMINKGIVLLEKETHSFAVEALKGLPRELQNKKLHIDDLPDQPFFTNELEENAHPWVTFFREFKLHIGLPINSSNRTIGILAFGEKLSGIGFNAKEIDFLESISNISATAIENSLMFMELQDVNRRLDHSNQELNTLFDIGNELNSSLDTLKIVRLLGYALMGQLLINKYAVYVKSDTGFDLKECRGLKDICESTENNEILNEFFENLLQPFKVNSSDQSEISTLLESNMIKLVIPMKIHDVVRGIICLGGKINKTEYSNENLEFLSTLSNQAMYSLENARLFEDTLEKQRIEEELAVARDIQIRLLPDACPVIEGLDIEAVNIPSKFVGGDYFDLIRLENDTLGVAIADVSGKGVPASLLMSNLQASLCALADVITDTAEMTARINNIIFKNTAADKFITYFYCRLDIKTLQFEYCNAGHNLPIIISKDKSVRMLDKGGLILGMMPDVVYEKDTQTLQKGDTLILYTDGITEAVNSEGEEFEEHRLLQLCKDMINDSACDLRKAIIDNVNAHSGDNPQYDDITLVILKVK